MSNTDDKRERLRKASQKYREANREKINAKNRARYAANPEKYIEQTKQWSKRNPEQHKLKYKRYQAANQEKIKAYRKRIWAALTPEQRQHKNSRIRFWRYGMSPEDGHVLFLSQGSVCACCGTSDPGRGWHVDHCHTTGDVRGIICSSCNLGLGHFKDDVIRLQRAIQYLLTHSSKR